MSVIGLIGLIGCVFVCLVQILFATDRRRRGTGMLVLGAVVCAVVAGLARPRLASPWSTVTVVIGLVAAVTLLGWAAARGWPHLRARVWAGEERARERGW